MSGAIEMCSGLGACRKTLDGTMCPSYMATKEEADVTRGRANVLRLAMNGRMGRPWWDDPGVYDVLDLCLECRACKAECPVGVDMARLKSEFLSRYWETYGTPLHAKMLGNVRTIARFGSPFASLFNWASESRPVRLLNEAVFGIDHRRTLPPLSRRTLSSQRKRGDGDVLLFNDTFTNFYDPEIGLAAWDVLESAGLKIALAPNHCCGRPLISKGLLKDARRQARLNSESLYEAAASGKKLIFCEPSCLSAVREDAPALLRGEERKKAEVVASACILFEEFAAELPLKLKQGPPKILLHGHCHQKAMGLLPAAKDPPRENSGFVDEVDLDAGCCGMAGSFRAIRRTISRSRAASVSAGYSRKSAPKTAPRSS